MYSISICVHCANGGFQETLGNEAFPSLFIKRPQSLKSQQSDQVVRVNLGGGGGWQPYESLNSNYLF